ncbi:unnamed protein product, partial [Amoebophrya sp. A25]
SVPGAVSSLNDSDQEDLDFLLGEDLEDPLLELEPKKQKIDSGKAASPSSAGSSSDSLLQQASQPSRGSS